MSSRIQQRLFLFLLLSMPLCLGQACGVSAPEGTDAGDGGTDEVTEPAPPPSTIHMQFANGSTAYAADVQFYASATPVTDPATELFIPEKRIIGNLGFAGTGLIPAGQVDTTEIACTNAVVVGTLGGRFIDQESGQEIAHGTQRLYRIGEGYACGDTITFRFQPDGQGVSIQLLIE
jgi:hypothetical protein